MFEDLKDISIVYLKVEIELSYMEIILVVKFFIFLLIFDFDCCCFYKIFNVKVYDFIFINFSVRIVDIIKFKLVMKI